ncbi:MarR family winged helix-turn-helix transcriptional regulator [Pseudemcibacter aquimaris]|uniref:MarR family winged helix-turn-helix transcriptional regulator n=1 Tax=Pseudemcibacter aquimaris TaxID=2857064 RepID=UPI0020121D24|nr:MarR family transcriptional regulator [Pseudemcibacter aquimaris]MCC3861555.1 MarR family transcriptional regulator [Pseudemcibacter aquimaris]WDU58324.1 MarR family transcriptional regulator [Pseudemcibacter aquimaris]
MVESKYTERQRESLKLWIELLRYSNKLEQIIDDKLRQNYGQNISRFDVLSQLVRENGDGLTVGELASRLIASKGNITGLIDRMQKDGLIVKTAKKDDRRSFIITITDNGTKLFTEMAENNAQWVENALSALDMEHMKEFTNFLNQSRATLDED